MSKGVPHSKTTHQGEYGRCPTDSIKYIERAKSVAPYNSDLQWRIKEKLLYSPFLRRA